MKGEDFFLSKTLGEGFFESLQKFELWKPGTKSTVDHEEIKTALQIVPRTLMSFLVHHLSSMEIGENKVTQLPVKEEGAMLNVTKYGPDVYSGNIEQGGKIIVDFKFRPIPGVGLVVMSAFELYDKEKLLAPPANDVADHALARVQKMIDERLALHALVNEVVDKKVSERDAVNQLLLMKLTEELHKEKEKAKQIAEIRHIHENSTPQSDPYFQGMTNGIEVANSIANNKEPKFVDAPKPLKKTSPIKDFLEKRKNKGKKNEFSIEIAKGEKVDCPDCGKNIFDGQGFSGCICLGDDMERKVYIKKNEDGINVRFSKGWDKENIEMLLDVLRRKRG